MPDNELLSAPLAADFFARDARIVARALIGTTLVLRDDSGDRLGRIVETEAYRGPADLACHARFGVTKRTRALFAAPGHAYVFFIYGMHQCFNVTCLREGAGHAVLVRAVEPLANVDGRGDGPGRLTRAFGIDRRHDGVSLVDENAPIVILPRAPGSRRPKIAVTARVGVAYAGAMAEAPLRFVDQESAHVSRPAAGTIGLGQRRALGKRNVSG